MTVKDVIQMAIDDLEKLKIPVGLIGEIGADLARTASNLRECVRAIEADGQNEEAGEDVQH